MYKIPDEFRDIPEAIRLREAEAECLAAGEEAKRLTQLSQQRVHLVYKDPLFNRMRSALENVKKALADFDAATGEPKPVGLTPRVLEEISKFFPEQQRRRVVDLLDQECGRKLPGRREATANDLEPARISALRLSRGNLVALQEWIDFAKIDERDVRSAAEDLMKDYPTVKSTSQVDPGAT